MTRVVTHLWFDHGEAEKAVAFYTGLIPGSATGRTVYAPSDTPSTAQGSVLFIEFSLAGHDFIALNGGPGFPFAIAMSIHVTLDDQETVDRVWDALVDNGGEESKCGWCKDRWGVSWQIVPAIMDRLLTADDPVAARRAFVAMLGMRRIDGPALERAFAG